MMEVIHIYTFIFDITLPIKIYDIFRGQNKFVFVHKVLFDGGGGGGGGGGGVF